MSFGQKALMRKIKPIVIQVNKSQIEDHIASFLYATNLVSDRKEITAIKFGDTSQELVSLEIYIRKEVSKKT